jgi:acetyltransferase-like isoleucine patch superfamily enzyme
VPSILHAAIAALAAVLPWPAKRAIYRYVLGHRVDPTAHVGVSLITVRHLVLGPRARIGHLNLIRNLDEVRLDEGAIIGNLNWVNAVPSEATDRLTFAPGRETRLHLHPQSAITMGHFLDCSDRLDVGPFATIAGFRCQVLTHSVDLATGNILCAPVRLDDFAFIATACVVLPGVHLTHHAVLGANSMMRDIPTEPYALYSGVPAEFVKDLPDDWGYFTRTKGRLD